MAKRGGMALSSLMLFFSLIAPVSSHEATETQTIKKQAADFSLEQELPLPESLKSESESQPESESQSESQSESELPQSKPQPVDDSAMEVKNPGKITLNLPIGYVWSQNGNGYVLVTVKGSNGYYPPISVQNGILDLNDLPYAEELKADPSVDISIQATLQSITDNRLIDCVGSKTMPGEQWFATEKWELDEDKVQATIDVADESDFAGAESPVLQLFDGSHTFSPLDLRDSESKILLKPGSWNVGYSGKKNRTGYWLRKTAQFDLQSDKLTFTNADLNDTLRIGLPETLQNTLVHGGGYGASFSNISTLVTVPGTYNVTVQQRITADNESYLQTWITGMRGWQYSTELAFDQPVLQTENFEADANGLKLQAKVVNGDFTLGYVKKVQSPTLSESVGNTSIKVISVQNEQVVYENEESGKEALNRQETFDSPLDPGSYRVEYTYLYPGLSEPLKRMEYFEVKSDESNLPGLNVYVEGETLGVPIKDGQVYVFEKLPPPVDDPVDFYPLYSTRLIYQTRVGTDGTFRIPYNKLLKGIHYELTVTGLSKDEESEVIYHEDVSREMSELRLTADLLKRLRFKSDIASNGDLLAISVLDEQEQLSSWPTIASFEERGVGKGIEATVYVHTNDKLSVFTKLYNRTSRAFYFLGKTFLPPEDQETTIDLDEGDEFQIKPPQGKLSSLDVNFYWNDPILEPAAFYISKNLDAVVSYSLDEGAFRFSFANYIGKVTDDVQLKRDIEFTNITDTTLTFQTGSVNQMVYTNFFDKEGNRLYDIKPLDVQPGIARMAPERKITFRAIGQEGADEVSIRVGANGKGFTYVSEPSTAAVSSLTSASAPGSEMDGEASLSADKSGVIFTEPFALRYTLLEKGLNGAIVSKPWSDSVSGVRIGIPKEEGSYLLKLDPTSWSGFLTLQSEVSIEVVGKQLSLPWPDGFDEQSFLDGSAELRPTTGDATGSIILSIANGKLILPEESEISEAHSYVLHLSMRLLDSNTQETVTYYNQRTITGKQLMELSALEFPQDAIPYQLAISGLPEQFRADLSDKRLRFFAGGHTEGAADSFVLERPNDRLYLPPMDFLVEWSGDNVGNDSEIAKEGMEPTGYEIEQLFHYSADTKTWTVTLSPTGYVSLLGNVPFLGLQSQADRFGPLGDRYSYRSNLLSGAYVTEGSRHIRLTTAQDNADEQWYYTWNTLQPLEIGGQSVEIPFTGEVEKEASQLMFSQSDNGGSTVITVYPQLVSGSLKLNSLQVGGSGDWWLGSAYPSVPAILTIKGASQNTVYEGSTYDWEDEIKVEQVLPDGTYTLTFSLPTGPNDNVELTKTFTVGSGGGTTGPETPGGGPGTPGTGTPGTGTPGGGTSTPGAGGTGGLPGGTSLQPDLNAPKTVEIEAKDVPAAVNGTVSVDIKDNEAVTIPAAALGGAANASNLEVKTDKGSVSIPPAVLEQLFGLVTPESLADAKISLQLEPLDDSEVAAAVTASPGTQVKPSGTVYDLKLTIATKDGKSVTLSQFGEPIKLTFEVDPAADKHLTGVYYMADDGKLTYVPGHYEGGQLVAEVSHFSRYGVLEVSKTFADVGASHWAYDAIRELAAKQVVSGVTDTLFAPSKKVTRAEFAAMLTHALGLKSDKPAPFKDVSADAWYASAVAAAYENGLIRGVSANTFAPNKQITREEMAAMIYNAAKLAKKTADTTVGGQVVVDGQTAVDGQAAVDGQPVADGQAAVDGQPVADGQTPTLSYPDASQIDSWAKEAVSAVSSLGLMKGNDKGQFAPKGQATRAEAAQTIANLLHLGTL